MVDDASHRDLLAGCLRSLGPEVAASSYDVLAGGISGAATYRVDPGDERVVLKIAAADSSPVVQERARREINFYRNLANRIPLRVPDFLDAAADATAPWLCLQAYRPPPPIQTWSRQQYVEIAQQLGRFHAAFWDRTEDLSGMHWLRRHDQPLTAPILERAVESWHELAAQPNYRTVLLPVELAWIETMVEKMDQPLPALRNLPPTLCHGDCHHGNLLIHGEGEWRWADWQEVGIGRGPEDLSFFLQRARMAGGPIPEDAAITAYHRSLTAAIAQPIPLTAVRQAVAASELRTLLIFWPPFLSQVSSTQMAGLVRRLHRLTGIAAL